MTIRNLKKILLQISLLLIVLNLGLVFEINKTNELYENRVIFLNVGQGDSILITSQKHIGLIDAGPGNIISQKLNEYLPVQTNILDFVVLTHFDKDHIEGFLRIANSFEIKNLYITNSLKENSLISEIKNLASSLKIPTFYLNSSNDFKFVDIDFNVIWPISNTQIFEEDSNDTSIGLEIKMGNCNIYTAGDLSSKFETESLQDLKDKDLEVLKLGHHGSRTSTSQEFLNLTFPDIAIVSAGENNSYGHPHKEVISTLLENNIEFLETKNQDVILKLNKNNTISLQQENTVKNIKCF